MQPSSAWSVRPRAGEVLCPPAPSLWLWRGAGVPHVQSRLAHPGPNSVSPLFVLQQCPNWGARLKTALPQCSAAAAHLHLPIGTCPVHPRSPSASCFRGPAAPHYLQPLSRQPHLTDLAIPRVGDEVRCGHTGWTVGKQVAS